MIERRFARAFNARDLGALAALLAADARTELVGSGFPPEEGAGAIRDGSFAHLFEDDDLQASPLTFEDTPYVAFHGEDDALDSLAALETRAGLIVAIRYHTRWHDAALLERVAGA